MEWVIEEWIGNRWVLHSVYRLFAQCQDAHEWLEYERGRLVRTALRKEPRPWFNRNYSIADEQYMQAWHLKQRLK